MQALAMLYRHYTALAINGYNLSLAEPDEQRRAILLADADRYNHYAEELASVLGGGYFTAPIIC